MLIKIVKGLFIYGQYNMYVSDLAQLYNIKKLSRHFWLLIRLQYSYSG